MLKLHDRHQLHRTVTYQLFVAKPDGTAAYLLRTPDYYHLHDRVMRLNTNSVDDQVLSVLASAAIATLGTRVGWPRRQLTTKSGSKVLVEIWADIQYGEPKGGKPLPMPTVDDLRKEARQSQFVAMDRAYSLRGRDIDDTVKDRAHADMSRAGVELYWLNELEEQGL